MSLFDGNGMSPADIAAVTGNNNGNGWGFGGDGAWWLLVLFLFMFNGNNGWGNGGGNNVTYNVDSAMQRGFDQSAIMSGLNGIQSTLSNGFAAAEASSSARQMADMQQAFALQSQFANCCCENRLGIANLGSDIAREACATRTADTQNMQMLANTINAGIQSINDKLCQQELDAERRENDNLRSQINMMNLAASQAAQTAQLAADNAAQTQYVVNRVAPYPVPSYQVPNPYAGYGWTNACGCTA